MCRETEIEILYLLYRDEKLTFSWKMNGLMPNYCISTKMYHNPVSPGSYMIMKDIFQLATPRILSALLVSLNMQAWDQILVVCNPKRLSVNGYCIHVIHIWLSWFFRDIIEVNEFNRWFKCSPWSQPKIKEISKLLQRIHHCG